MNRIGQERNAARGQNNSELQAGRDRKDHERPFDSPDARSCGGNRGVDDAVGVPVISAMPVIVAMSGFLRLRKAEPDESGAKHLYS